MKKIALLGSTGSIGRQVLQIVDRYPEKYSVVSLCCNQNAKLLGEQINKYKPLVAGLTNPENVSEICALPTKTTLYTGENAMLHCILEQADVVVVAVVGFCGLKAVLQALQMKKPVALANKEALIAGGELVMPLAKKMGVPIIPIDSEHSAIWQSLCFDQEKPFKRILLTASGGALRNHPIEDLDKVTPEMALAHPNWKMGAKITIDCATMVNKGLEVMEACWLFNCEVDKVKVLIHPQSIVHSMVEYADNAVIAQLSSPSMDIPIQLALSYPERFETEVLPVDFSKGLTFSEVDLVRYPCFELALRVAKLGGLYPCAFSGANEQAVSLFLNGAIPYTHIYKYLDYAVKNTQQGPVTYDNLVRADAKARALVLSAFKEKAFD